MWKYNIFTRKLDYMEKSSYGVKFEFGIRVVGGYPYMDDGDDKQYVYVPSGKHYYFDEDTEEIKEKTD